MLRHRTIVCLAGFALLGGCTRPSSTTMTLPTKPSPAPELAKLERFMGKWTGSADLVFPSREDLKKRLPAGSSEPQTTFANGETAAWSLGGMHLRRDGWFEMPGGQKQHYVEYVTWDAREKKFRTSMVSDWGDFSDGWMTLSADGLSAEMKTSGYDAAGNLTTGHATMRFVDDDTIEWTWSEKGPHGAMTLRGKNRRR